MKDNELITRKNIELALLNKGQHSRRYKLGDTWELNYDEIREVLDDVDADVQPVVHCSECANNYSTPHNPMCDFMDAQLYPDSFCSKGKRKGGRQCT